MISSVLWLPGERISWKLSKTNASRGSSSLSSIALLPINHTFILEIFLYIYNHILSGTDYCGQYHLCYCTARCIQETDPLPQLWSRIQDNKQSCVNHISHGALWESARSSSHPNNNWRLKTEIICKLKGLYLWLSVLQSIKSPSVSWSRLWSVILFTVVLFIHVSLVLKWENSSLQLAAETNGFTENQTRWQTTSKHTCCENDHFELFCI